MFSVSSLSEEQKKQIEQWAAEGDQLPDLQKKMEKEFGISITYMDTRFAIIDLGIELQSPEVEEDSPEEEEKKELTPLGYVDATVDELVRPGLLVSGKVTFSDGMKALWGIDQMGRLQLDPDQADYKVSDEDMIAFQETLRDKLKDM